MSFLWQVNQLLNPAGLINAGAVGSQIANNVNVNVIYDKEINYVTQQDSLMPGH
jgi:hypothetical protein